MIMEIRDENTKLFLIYLNVIYQGKGNKEGGQEEKDRIKVICGGSSWDQRSPCTNYYAKCNLFDLYQAVTQACPQEIFFKK